MANVQNIFSWLRYGNPSENIPQMTSNDVLVIWTFGHGWWDNVNNNAALIVADGLVWDYDFATYVNPVASQKRMILMQQCHSGGFIDNLQSSKTVMLTVCNPEEVAAVADNFYPDGGDERENEMGYGGVTIITGNLTTTLSTRFEGRRSLDTRLTQMQTITGEFPFLKRRRGSLIMTHGIMRRDCTIQCGPIKEASARCHL
jgi:hypothetical protein